MTDPRHIGPRSATWGTGGRGVVLVLTFLFVLAAVSGSTGFVVYTASHHDFANGLFALAFAVLSARAALSGFGGTTSRLARQQISDVVRG